MALNDPLANVLSNITNAEKLKKVELTVKDNNKMIRTVLEIMKTHKYLGEIKPVERSLNIKLLGTLNKANVIKPRFSVGMDDYDKYEKRYLPAKDFGFLIVSTNKGVMTHVQAKEKNLGGKLIAYCY